MSLEQLSSLLGAVLVDASVDQNTRVKTDTFVAVPKRHKLRIRQAVGLELLEMVRNFTDKDIELGEMNPSKKPCGFLRKLQGETKLFIFEGQGQTGRVIKGCFDKTCNKFSKQFGIKLLAYNNVPTDPTATELPQNYEVYILNLLNRLVYEKHTPHIVLLYLSYICRCGDYIPLLQNNDVKRIGKQLRHELTSASKTILTKFLSEIPYDRRRINKGVAMSHNTETVFAALLNNFYNPSNMVMEICCIWTAWITNYFRTLVFPPVRAQLAPDRWVPIKFQMLILLAMIFHKNVLGVQIQLFAFAAYYDADSDLENVRNKIELGIEWLEYVRVINSSTEILMNQKFSLELQHRLTELVTLSDMLPVTGITVSPDVQVGSRVYNFFVRTLLTEWVTGQPLRAYLQANWYLLSADDYAVIYFQYLYTMYVIQKHYPGFSHNDGHLDNILLALNHQRHIAWPHVFHKKVQRNGKSYTVTIQEVFGSYAVSMTASQNDSIEFTSWEKPTLLEKPKDFSEYKLLNQVCYVPSTSLSVRLWDFDWANISGAGVQNQKVILEGNKNSIYVDAGQYYDIYLFFQQIWELRYMSTCNVFKSDCKTDYDLLFPKEIQDFHERVLNMKPACVRATYQTQRLTDTATNSSYPTIQTIIQKELDDGIFKRFKTQPSGRAENIYQA